MTCISAPPISMTRRHAVFASDHRECHARSRGFVFNPPTASTGISRRPADLLSPLGGASIGNMVSYIAVLAHVLCVYLIIPPRIAQPEKSLSRS